MSFKTIAQTCALMSSSGARKNLFETIKCVVERMLKVQNLSGLCLSGILHRYSLMDLNTTQMLASM